MLHLNVHSCYSLLEGTSDPRALVGRVVAEGMTAMALTDTNGLYGVIPFYEAARDAGVKPLLGATLEGTVLLARNRDAYARLCEIITAYHLDEDGAFDLLKSVGKGEGLFLLTSDRSLAMALRKQGADVFISITHWGDRASRYHAQTLRDWALDQGLRPVAVNPIYFLEADDWETHRTLTAIRLNTTIGCLKASALAPSGAWFRSSKSITHLYEDWPECLANIDYIVEECNVELELGRPIFPEFPVPDGESDYSYLWKKSFEGVGKRYHPLSPQVIKRLQYELDIIHQLGFAPYFLIVWDIVRFANAEGIPVMGRGSAANSLVAYALGITRVDPLKYDLYFERFLNLSRSDCPDIDLDLCWKRRDEVIDYVYQRYGSDRVAMICTMNTFQARSAVREVAKAHGMTPDEVTQITRKLPRYSARDIRTLANHLPESQELNIEEEPLKTILDICERIDGLPRHLSIHSGGVVIAPRAMTEFTPLQRAAKGIVITQYNMGPIETLGLVKIDLLGHRSLTVIVDTVRKVRENRGIEIDVEALLDADPLTVRLLRSGQTIGCFQIESPAMRALLRNTMTDSIDMLIKSIALVRPGASGSGMKKQFIERRHGTEETTYLHSAMENVLEDTYGTMIYQEDVMKVAHVIAGLDLAEGDSLRRAMGKKRSPSEMAKSMKNFIEKAIGNGVEESIAEEIWGLMSNFAQYSYCKAHASSYGEIAYQCTYLKAHFPAEFLSSVLSNRGGFYHPAVYIEEVRRLGIELRPLDVNKSDYEYIAEDEAIRIGFVEVRHLAFESIEKILMGRVENSFTSVGALWWRGKIAQSDIGLLINAGACDGFGCTRPELLWELKMITKACAARSGAAPHEATLFDDGGVGKRGPQLPDYTRKHRIDLEWESLGLPISTHPIEYYLSALNARPIVLSHEMGEYAGGVVCMLGWLIAERRVGLKERGVMKFLTLEDGAGVYEAILFPEAYQRCGHLLDSHGPYLITGEIQNDHHYHSLTVETLERIGEHHESGREI